MVKYVLKRLILMLFTFFVIMLIGFVLIKLLPLADLSGLSPDQRTIIENSRIARGYNKPILEQFIIYWRRALLHGDFGLGETYLAGQDVAKTFISKLPATMYVNLLSIIFSIPLGIGLGIYAALRKNKWQDHVVSTGIMVFISVPNFVLAFLLQYIFYFKLGWFPALMASTVKYGWFSWTTLKSVIMPVFALSLGTIAGFARSTRAELTEVLTSEFMLLARTKGLTKGQSIMRHALRNIAVIIVPGIMGAFIGILGGSLVIEKFFSIPGVGGLYLNAVQALDYNFFMIESAFYTFVGLLAGIVVDISYGFIDPRIRMGGGKQ